MNGGNNFRVTAGNLQAENPMISNSDSPQDSLDGSLVLPYSHTQLNVNKN